MPCWCDLATKDVDLPSTSNAANEDFAYTEECTVVGCVDIDAAGVASAMHTSRALPRAVRANAAHIPRPIAKPQTILNATVLRNRGGPAVTNGSASVSADMPDIVVDTKSRSKGLG